jgi:hypothetical protein
MKMIEFYSNDVEKQEWSFVPQPGTTINYAEILVSANRQQ